MFSRTPRESMNMARNPTAFLELVKMVKGNIRIIPTAYTFVAERLLESHTSNKNPRPNDAALFEMYEHIVKDLEAIKKSFLSGE